MNVLGNDHIAVVDEEAIWSIIILHEAPLNDPYRPRIMKDLVLK